jgi:flavin-dependent dehydrogenase
VIGEAAGTTYAVSGEGIGKAMESGLLLADVARESGDLPSAGARYAAEMARRHGARFRAYATAERWIARPLIADYVARRANQSRWVHDRLTGIITERALPTKVFSARSIWKLLTRE